MISLNSSVISSWRVCDAFVFKLPSDDASCGVSLFPDVSDDWSPSTASDSSRFLSPALNLPPSVYAVEVETKSSSWLQISLTLQRRDQPWYEVRRGERCADLWEEYRRGQTQRFLSPPFESSPTSFSSWRCRLDPECPELEKAGQNILLRLWAVNRVFVTDDIIS